jgi:hypothetical protein
MPKPRLSPFIFFVAALLLVLWVAFFAWGWALPATKWARLLPGFDLAEAHFGASPVRWISKVVAIWLSLLTLLSAGLVLFAHFRARLQEQDVKAQICSLAAAVGVVCILFDCMVTHGWDLPTYPIQAMMTNPRSVAVFGQRLLLVWPAMLLKHILPRLSYIQAFLAVQGVAIVIMVYVVGQWSALFVGQKQKYLGQILLAVFLLPTFGYYNAHDTGVVIFYTLCFLFLYRKQYWLFGLAFAVGILNHQNILLLIPTAVAVMWGREKRSTVLWVAGATSVVYFLIRFTLNATIPIPQTHEVKVWWNMRQVAELKQTLVLGELSVLPWYVLGAAAWDSADPFLKRAAILLPMQYLIYFAYGQLNEARVFNGFVPILIGIFLCYFREHFFTSTVSRSRSALLSTAGITTAREFRS